MLVLSRKTGERIQIGDNITVVVNKVAGNRVTIGIEAPGEVRIVRGELEVFQEEPQQPVQTPQPVAAQNAAVPLLPVENFNSDDIMSWIPRNAR